MLSQNTSFMDQRQRHQRRQSAPSEIEATNILQSPATYQQSAPYQEASMLSQPMDQFRQYAQENGKLNNTNQGHHQQHYLQVAQLHSQAGPGQQQYQQYQPHQSQHNSPLQLSEQQFKHLQHMKLEAQLNSLLHTSSFSPQTSNQHYVRIERTRSNPEANNDTHITQTPRENVMMFNQDGILFPIEQSYTANTSPLLTDWSMPLQRPFTPPQQNNNGYFPVTPVYSPYGSLHGLNVGHVATARQPRSVTHTPSQMIHEHFGHNHTSPGAIVNNTQRRNSTRDLFNDYQMEFVNQTLPSPPQTMPMKSSRHFDVTIMPTVSLENISKLSFTQAEQAVDVEEEGGSTEGSPCLASLPHSPETHCCQQTSDVVLPIRERESPSPCSPLLEACTGLGFGPWDGSAQAPLSPRAMPMNDLGLDATIEDTGISAEEVQSYISEQDTATGKWSCLYPDCTKVFGRKENIRSHIQTHLNDRQFKCAHCSKKFVRQHDLKRHAKIHSGVKPFPCRCGNTFARHDALTRHRQRGICDGGFAGVVKKAAKRGRPRKERLDNAERIDKSSRSRKRAAEISTYASSVSGTSESSFPDSPPMDCDAIDMCIMPSANMESPTMQCLSTQELGLAPSAFSYTPAVSPYSTGMVPSPSKTFSDASGLSPSSLSLDDEHYHGNGSEGSDMASVEANPFTSQPGSPPELSHSSPPSSTTRHHDDLDLLAIFNSSGMGQSRTDRENDYDMLGFVLDDATPAPNDSPWNQNYDFGFDTRDKESKEITPDFEAEELWVDE